MNPITAERHPGLLFPQQVGPVSNVYALLKQCYPGLAPKLPAQKKRGIRRNRQHRTGYRLGPVVLVDHLFKWNLQMRLKTGVTRFEKYGLMTENQFLNSSYLEIEVISPYFFKNLVELLVTRIRGNVLEYEIPLSEGRQNSGKDNVILLNAIGNFIGFLNSGLQVLLHF